MYPVLTNPEVVSGQIEVTDCDNDVIFGVGLVATINGNASCPCGYPVPAVETTWGRVKALYVE